MVLQGIANENEFYSAHYLSAILAGDLKTFAKQKTDQRAVQKAEQREALADEPSAVEGADDDEVSAKSLGSLRQEYFRLKDALLGRLEPAEKLANQRVFLQKLLEILGYDWRPQVKSMESGYALPVVAEVDHRDGLWVMEGFNETGEPSDVLSLGLSPFAV